MRTLTVCATYGRIPFLDRMLASFLSQTFDDKHLVIVNDDKHVELCCDHKAVSCINLNKKVLLPQKRNIGNGLGYYDLIFPFDDDDIFLPDRIANYVQKHKDHPEINLYRNEAAYIIYGDVFSVSESSPTACSYLQKAWYEVGGYRHPINSGEDQEYFNKMPNKLIERNSEILDFVYNWGGVNYHATSTSDSTTDEIAYRQLEQLNLVGKKYWIEPNFEEFNKFTALHSLYAQHKNDLQIIHSELAKIEIDHLYS